MTFSTDPANAADIDQLTQMLAALSYGGVLTYEEMNAATGRDIRHNGNRWLLLRARASAEAENMAIFETVRGIGIKRLPPDELAMVGTAATRKIRRTANIAHKRLGYSRGNDISGEARDRIDAHRSLLGAISAIARENAVKRLSAAEGSKTIPSNIVLDRLRDL